MTRAPLVHAQARRARSRAARPTMDDTTLGWRFVNPRMEELDRTGMGETAENVAERYEVSREPSRTRSRVASQQRRAAGAQDAGRFAREIVARCAVGERQGRRDRAGRGRRGSAPRHDARGARRAARRSFREGGTVTAGNASQHQRRRRRAAARRPSAGCSELGARAARARRRRPAPRASTRRTWASGPIPATRKALERAGLDASTTSTSSSSTRRSPRRSLAVHARARHRPHERVNVNGGAIALGHPLGCSGARLVTHAGARAARRGARYGMAAMCIGVGQGLATIIENVDS